jgi:hypothetical protein
MAAGGVDGEIMRSTSITVPTTISRRITTIILKNTRTRVRIGSITRSTGGMPSTRIRQRLRSMGSSVQDLEAGQLPQTPGATAVVQVRKVAEGHKPATSVVGGAVRVLLVDLAMAEAKGHRAIAARRAAVLLPGVVGHPAAVEEPPVAVVGHPAAVEEPPVAAEEAAVVVAVVEQEIEKNDDKD